MKPDRELLIEGIDYDLWATQAWLPVLEKFKNREQADEVMNHILYAQRLWINRLAEALGEEHPESTDGLDLSEALAKSAEQWKQIISRMDLEVPVTWHRRFDGITRTMTSGELALHISMHGSYHRGELRGLAKAEGLEEFYNTDLLFWCDAARQPGRTFPLSEV